MTEGLPGQQPPPEYGATPALAGGSPPLSAPRNPDVWAGQIGDLAITHKQLLSVITGFYRVLEEDRGRTEA